VADLAREKRSEWSRSGNSDWAEDEYLAAEYLAIWPAISCSWMNLKKAAMKGFLDEPGERYTPAAGRVKRERILRLIDKLAG
jgi:hypothetical protein